MFNKFQGCLIGLAIGDALGAPVQFRSRDTFKISSYQKGGDYNVDIGEYTDDTAMALCLAESLIKDGFSTKSQLDIYIKWYEYGYLGTRDYPFDIGITVSMSLDHYKQTKNEFSPFIHEEYSGNGSIMRLVPVIMYFINDLENAVYYAGISSTTTHSSPIAIDACRLLAFYLFYIFHGYKKDLLFSKYFFEKIDNFFKESPLHPKIENIAKGFFIKKQRPQINSTGYVVHTLQAALWSFYSTDSFEESLIKAANLGDDADTVGAVTGQLAGAYYGLDSINKKYILPLYNKELILEYAKKLYFKNFS